MQISFLRNTLFRFFVVVMLMSISLIGACAQPYLLGQDDVIKVTVQRHPELSAEQISITSSGKIDLPEAGQIYVAGRTTNEVALAITRALSRTVVQPDVTVSLVQQRSRRIFVLGAVAKPGVYEMKPGWHVAQALAAAGGLAGLPEETSATLARARQRVLAINVASVIRNPDSPENRVLQSGDVLVVTALDPKRITVSGDVVRPDIYPLRRAPRLLDALVAAGGLKTTARASRGFVLRGGEKIPLDLQAAVDYENPQANLALLPGDLVSIESIPALKVSVDGFVKTPGNFNLESGSGVIQAIAQAGGLTTTADNVVASVRRGGQILPVDLARAPFDTTADVALQSGDVVLLSEPKIIRVQVAGQVNKPGALRLAPDSTVLDAIARSGGLSIRRESARIDVLRTLTGAKQVTLRIDPITLLGLNDLRQNPKLQDGDLISVTQVRSQIAFISGEVARPGAYEIKEGDGLPELIARAGGASENAALKQATLQRDNQTRTIDIRSSLIAGSGKPDVPLQDGDFVVVPRNTARVLVMQAVQKPGYYPIPEDGTLTVGEAVSEAGGPRDRAAIEEVAIFRQTPAGLQRRMVQLNKITGKKGEAQIGLNTALQNGDIVYVPQGRVNSSFLDKVGRGLGLAGSLRFLGAF